MEPTKYYVINNEDQGFPITRFFSIDVGQPEKLTFGIPACEDPLIAIFKARSLLLKCGYMPQSIKLTEEVYIKIMRKWSNPNMVDEPKTLFEMKIEKE